jgi:MipA family protein
LSSYIERPVLVSNIRSLAVVVAVCGPAAAFAEEVKEPARTRVALGVQLVPSFPGSDKFSLRPLIDVARRRGEAEYEFEAPDESFGFSILRSGGFSVGPAIAIEGSRTAKEVGADLPKVGLTVEVGGFARYTFSKNVRVFGEVRKGLGGHEGLISTVGADYVSRKGNEWLLSLGPRITFADKRYHRAYLSVLPKDASNSGLAAYSAGGGISAVGAAAGYIKQLTPRWGIYSYAKYDRLVGDAAASPIVRRFGSKDQISGGVALTYTFGRGL